MSKNKKPKILLYDIETLYNIAATWGVYEQSFPHANIRKERSIICVCYKWLGEEEVHTISIADRKGRFKKDPHDDEYVLKQFRKVIIQADAVITHNGDSFDTKYFNTRALFHGLSPIPTIPSIDTYKVAKKYFRFNSNSLDYISKFLGGEGKTKIGNQCWLRILDKDIEAVYEMSEYCEQDVLELERIYYLLRPSMTNHPNFNLFTKDESPVCPVCSSTGLQKRGTRVTRTGKYQRYQCQGCGAWSSSGRSLDKAEIR